MLNNSSEKMIKENCWEVKKCGREEGGINSHELGVCPASTYTSVDGMNSGKNAGRYCWAIAGTLCGGIVQGSFAVKRTTCIMCDFFTKVRREENSDFQIKKF